MPSAYLAANMPGEPAPEDAGLTANVSGLPDDLFAKYSKGPTAQLMPADPKKGYSTSYYAAYTNDGDLAGAVMVADGQKVRLVDKMTGDVVFEGVGPEGARLATSVANGISQDMGRKAAWAIQKPTDEGGWVSMAEERYDPKKQSALGKLADFALPILGAILMPVTGGMSAFIAAGLGSAAGSALSSIAQGRPLDETLKRAAIAGVTAGVGAKVAPMLGNALANAPQNAVTNAMNTGYSAVMNPLNAVTKGVQNAAGVAGKAIQGGLDAAGNVIVTPTITSATTSGALSSAAGTAASGALKGSSGKTTVRGDAGSDTLSQGNTVEGVDVTGTNVDAVTGGALGAAVPQAPLSQGEAEVEELVIKGEKEGVSPYAAGLATHDVVRADETIPSNVEGLTTTADALGPDSPAGQLGSKIAAGEIVDKVLKGAEIASKVAPLISAAGGGGSDSKTGSGIPPGFATAGTPGSLSDKFRANLPAPSGPFGNLAARNVSMTPEEWKTYGARPEQSFFANVPIRPSGIIDTSKRAPPTPGPEEAKGFRTGGFAVRGPGTGRSDDIPARLSDGEYVIDAETVALLGDGSTQAGSKRLDDFRVNIRKHKGRQLSKGKFSHNARKPEAYLHGGRV